MSVDNLLNKLNKVKRNGTGSWMAQCPCHQDKTASLAIKDMQDGRIIINCFAGCDTYSILSSIGLDWADVMPEKLAGHAIKPEKQIIYASDALRLIRRECQIILAGGYHLRKTGVALHEDLERMAVAMQRINKAMELSNVE